MDRIWVFLAALLFSTGGAAIKGNSLTAGQVACFRSLVAVVALAVLFPRALRGWTLRHAVVAVAYAAVLFSFVAANKLTTAANAIFLQATAPAYMIVLSPLLLREHVRRSDLWLFLGVGAGMALFFISAEPPRTTAPDPATGNIFAVVSGITWALTVIGLRWVGRRDDGAHASMATVILGNLLTFGLGLPAALPFTGASFSDIAVLLYLGVFQIGLAYYCLTRALMRISAFETATLLLVESAMNPLWTWLILGERPALLSIAGGAVILTSTVANTWWQSRQITTVRPSGAA